MNLASCRYGTGRFYPFDEMGIFNNYKDVNSPNDLDKADCLVVWGGADISPSLYNRPVSKYCHADEKPSMRDAYEWACMKRAKELGIPIIGICRGAQMLCALAGGHLIQHVEGHGRSHSVVTVDGREFKTNSMHHQMMYPWDVEHVMVAWSKEHQSKVHLDVDENVNVALEPEFVYFPKVRGAAIQWHPEFMSEDQPSTEYIAKWLKENLCQ